MQSLNGRFSLLSLVIALSAAGIAVPDDLKPDRPGKEFHSWEAIVYPSLPCPWATKWTVPSLCVGRMGKARSLLFNLKLNWSASVEGSLNEPDPEQISVRLHYTDGTVNDPKQPVGGGFVDGFSGWIGNSRGGTGYFQRTFPWGKNDLREAWIELRVPGAVYWLGVPYGFTRDPSEPLCPSEETGDPKFAPAMRDLEKGAKIVNCQYVEYEIVLPKKECRVTLRQSNPFDAACELVLYRDDFRGWNLFSPRTAVSIQQPNLDALVGDCWNIRKHDDMLRRSDYFKFNRNGGSGDTRCWGTIVVKVGDDEANAIVPSSLFNYVHGVADPYHKANFR